MSRTHLRIILFVFIALIVALAVVVALAGDGDDQSAAGGASTTATQAIDPPAPTDVAATPEGTQGTQTQATPAPAFAYTPLFEEGRCRFTEPTGQEPICGWLTVPENRSIDDGNDVRIHVAIFESETAGAAAEPIVYLDGGPGGETLGTLWFSFDVAWAPLLQHGDLIFFDQRGVGYSEPSLACPEELALTLDLIDEDIPAIELIDRELAALGECRDRLVEDGVDLSAYDSAANAADVADLRAALGYDEWNLLGISYGTRLAQTVLRDHPDGVRAAVLDSTYPLDANLITEAPANLDRAFDVLFATCLGNGACNNAYPDLRRRVFSLAAELDASPLSLTVRDFLKGDQHDAVLTGRRLLGTFFEALYSDQLLSQLPEMLAELERGETSIVSLLISNSLSQGDFFSFGMHLSVQCREEVSFTSSEDIVAGLVGFEEYGDLFAESINLSTPMLQLCDLWDAGVAPPVENRAVSSSIPVLVLAGTFDPITPPRWGRAVAADLANSFFVEFPTLGHGVSIADECPTGITLGFLADPTAPPATTCIDGMNPVAFVSTPFDPSTVAFEDFTEDFLGLTISGLAPAGWELIQPGTWARGESGLDQTVLVQQAVPALGVSAQFFLEFFASQFGIEDPFELRSEVPSPGGRWDGYVGSFDSFVVDVAVRESEGILALVVLVTDQDEHDALFGAVLGPVLEAFAAS